MKKIKILIGLAVLLNFTTMSFASSEVGKKEAMLDNLARLCENIAETGMLLSVNNSMAVSANIEEFFCEKVYYFNPLSKKVYDMYLNELHPTSVKWRRDLFPSCETKKKLGEVMDRKIKAARKLILKVLLKDLFAKLFPTYSTSDEGMNKKKLKTIKEKILHGFSNTEFSKKIAPNVIDIPANKKTIGSCKNKIEPKNYVSTLSKEELKEMMQDNYPFNYKILDKLSRIKK